MAHALDRPQRRTVRLRGYDYADAGASFVTVVAQDRACLFGEVVDDVMRLNAAGLVVVSWWGNLGRHFPSVLTDEFVVTPNHIHGIVFLGANIPAEAWQMRDIVAAEAGDHTGSPLPADGAGNTDAGTFPTLATVVGWFKTRTTNDYIWGVKNDAYPPFRGRLWQRNFYEHIIRTDQTLDRIRTYIADNPSRWHDDDENPDRVGR